MKKVAKAEAFKALENILDATVDYVKAEDIITLVRSIEQQWEPEEQTETVRANGEKPFKVIAKSEGTI